MVPTNKFCETDVATRRGRSFCLKVTLAMPSIFPS